MSFIFQSRNSGDSVVSRVRLSASPERVFRAWTVPEEVKLWFGQAPNSLQRAEIDLRVGGKWQFVFVDQPELFDGVVGEYVEILEPGKLVFSWSHQRIEGGRATHTTRVSTVAVTIEESESGSILTVRHYDLESPRSSENVSVGWRRALVSLVEALNGGLSPKSKGSG